MKKIRLRFFGHIIKIPGSKIQIVQFNLKSKNIKKGWALIQEIREGLKKISLTFENTIENNEKEKEDNDLNG